MRNWLYFILWLFMIIGYKDTNFRYMKTIICHVSPLSLFLCFMVHSPVCLLKIETTEITKEIIFRQIYRLKLQDLCWLSFSFFRIRCQTVLHMENPCHCTGNTVQPTIWVFCACLPPESWHYSMHKEWVRDRLVTQNTNSASSHPLCWCSHLTAINAV